MGVAQILLTATYTQTMLGLAWGRHLGAMQGNPFDHIYLPDPDTVKRTIAGETILIPIRNRVGDLSSIFVLNELGTSVWTMLEQQRPVSFIVDSVVEEYDVSREEAASDVIHFLSELKNAGLIQQSK